MDLAFFFAHLFDILLAWADSFSLQD